MLDLKSKFSPFQLIQLLGVLLGGIGPILLFLFGWLLWGIEGDVRIGKRAFAAIAVASAIVGGLALILSLCERSDKEKPWFKGCLQLEVGLSFLVIFLVIVSTGGSKDSVFASICLYMPAVVGYVYGHEEINPSEQSTFNYIYKRVKSNLIGASIGMAVIYLLGLLTHTAALSWINGGPQYELRNSPTAIPGGPIPIKCFFFAFFIIQLLVVVYIVPRSESTVTGA
jgi:hypothetical protein